MISSNHRGCLSLIQVISLLLNRLGEVPGSQLRLSTVPKIALVFPSLFFQAIDVIIEDDGIRTLQIFLLIIHFEVIIFRLRRYLIKTLFFILLHGCIAPPRTFIRFESRLRRLWHWFGLLTHKVIVLLSIWSSYRIYFYI